MSIALDWDRGAWLYVPAEFPWTAYPDEAAWLDAVVATVAAAGGDDSRTEFLLDYLPGLRANNTQAAHRFSWLGDGFATLATLDAHSWPHDPALSLHEISGADGVETDARLPLVTELEFEGLGRGVRVERAMRVSVTDAESLGEGGPTEIVFIVFWVFRGAIDDVVFTMANADPIAIARTLEDAEKLVAAASVVSD